MEQLPSSEILLYQTEDARTRVEVRFDQNSAWLTQAQMAELFQTTPQNITLHLRSIYEEGELSEAATCKDYLQVRTEGQRQVRRAITACFERSCWRRGIGASIRKRGKREKEEIATENTKSTKIFRKRVVSLQNEIG